MMTLLPYISFDESAETLDSRRLGKQCDDGVRILMTLWWKRNGKKPRYRSHPGVLMWEDYERSLAEYAYSCQCEWEVRHGKHRSSFYKLVSHEMAHVPKIHLDPPWLGDDRLHLSHQSYLIRECPEHYESQFAVPANSAPFFIDVPDSLPFFWPVRKDA